MSATLAATAGRSPSRATLVRAAPWCLLGYGLLVYLLSVAQVPNAVLAILVTAVTHPLLVALIMLTCGGFVALELPRWAELADTVCAALVWWLLSYHAGPKPPRVVVVLAMLAMILAVIGLARVLATWLLKEKNLLPICLVLMGVVDLWGVTVGFTARALEQTPEKVAKASAALPALQAKVPLGFALPDLSIGPGDVLFAALILAVVARHGLSLRRNLAWMYGLFMLGLALAAFTPWAVPGLVFIGAAGLLANRGQWDYTADEKRNLKIVTALLVPLLLIAGLALRNRPEPPRQWHDAPAAPVTDQR